MCGFAFLRLVASLLFAFILLLGRAPSSFVIRLCQSQSEGAIFAFLDFYSTLISRIMAFPSRLLAQGSLSVSVLETSPLSLSFNFVIVIPSSSTLLRPSDRRGIELARYRNMRSKYQRSLCLQFTLFLGAGPVLHRPTSQVIHRLEWDRFDPLVLQTCFIRLSRVRLRLA